MENLGDTWTNMRGMIMMVNTDSEVWNAAYAGVN